MPFPVEGCGVLLPKRYGKGRFFQAFRNFIHRKKHQDYRKAGKLKIAQQVIQLLHSGNIEFKTFASEFRLKPPHSGHFRGFAASWQKRKPAALFSFGKQFALAVAL